jgi:hypothetical protein
MQKDEAEFGVPGGLFNSIEKLRQVAALQSLLAIAYDNKGYGLAGFQQVNPDNDGYKHYHYDPPVA